MNTRDADRFGEAVRSLSRRIDDAMILMPWETRYEAAGDVGVLALALRTLVVTVPGPYDTGCAAAVTALRADVEFLVDTVHRCPSDAERGPAFGELRTAVDAARPAVDELIASLGRLSGCEVCRADLLAEARSDEILAAASFVRTEMARLDQRDTGPGRRGGETFDARELAAAYSTSSSPVPTRRSPSAASRPVPASPPVDAVPAAVAKLTVIELTDGATADRYRRYAIQTGIVAMLVPPTAVVVAFFAPWVPTAAAGAALWGGIAALSTYCAHESREHRAEQRRARLGQLPEDSQSAECGATVRKGMVERWFDSMFHTNGDRADSPMPVDRVWKLLVAVVVLRGRGNGSDRTGPPAA